LSSSSRPSSPPPLRVSTSPPPATRKHRQLVIDLTSDSDDKIYVVATCIKQKPRTPLCHTYKRHIAMSTPPPLSRSLDTSTSFLSLPSPGLLSPFPTVLMPWKKWLHYIIYTATPLYLDLLYNGFVPWIKLHLILFLSLC
jgi:hypothetical protein